MAPSEGAVSAAWPPHSDRGGRLTAAPRAFRAYAATVDEQRGCRWRPRCPRPIPKAKPWPDCQPKRNL